MTKELAINAGSSTLKWTLFEMPAKKVLARGLVDRINLPESTFTAKIPGDTKYQVTQDNISYNLAATMLLDYLKDAHLVEHLHEITGIGHRVVAGGEAFQDSAIIDDKNLEMIRNLSDYAPLHNPIQARFIEIFQKLLPEAGQVAVFDTSLYAKMPKSNFLYPIPYEYYTEYGVRKYGAHGTSHRFVSHRAAKILGKDFNKLKMITCHLGSGSSITAFKDGQVIDTSMGFTPLGGVMMATRSGDIDASIVDFLATKLNKSVGDINDILNRKSGLLGISGISPDQRDLENAEDTDKRAKLALKMYVNRVVRFIGSYIAELGGLDVLVFTAGSGENGILLRERIMKQLEWYGVKLDESKNNIRGQEQIISTDDSSVTAMVVPTNEELMIVEDVERLLN